MVFLCRAAGHSQRVGFSSSSGANSVTVFGDQRSKVNVTMNSVRLDFDAH